MARIRTIKPEFWSSPSVAKASPWARLLFIAMWNWADDHGRGTANLKELEGFAFPMDDAFTDRSGNTVHFRSLVAEVSECFDVVFYEVDGRPYFEIPTWDSHQRNERRAKESKYPQIPVAARKSKRVAEIPSRSTADPNISGPGTGEQGNRGTGEQGKKLSNDSKESQDCNAREFSQEEISEVKGILGDVLGRHISDLEASVAVELITEAAAEPVENLHAYISASIEKSPKRIYGLTREAVGQVARL